MFRWNVILEKGADHDLAKLDKLIRQRILEKIEWLGSNFDDILPQTLSSNLSQFYKLRVGDWRVVYAVTANLKTISIVAIGHRKNIYKRRLS